MHLVTAYDKYIVELMQWFESEYELRLWSGGDFNYPFDLASFKRDACIHSLCSKVLLSATGELLAFGQYYLRLGHCHLARLVVNPHMRGQGLVAVLIEELSRVGKCELGVLSSCSLFVMADNTPAIKAYSKLGFKFAAHPKPMTIDNCLYMLKTMSSPKA